MKELLFYLIFGIVLYYILRFITEKYYRNTDNLNENFDPSLVPVSSIVSLAKITQEVVNNNGVLTSPGNLEIGTNTIPGSLVVNGNSKFLDTVHINNNVWITSDKINKYLPKDYRINFGNDLQVQTPNSINFLTPTNSFSFLDDNNNLNISGNIDITNANITSDNNLTINSATNLNLKSPSTINIKGNTKLTGSITTTGPDPDTFTDIKSDTVISKGYQFGNYLWQSDNDNAILYNTLSSLNPLIKVTKNGDMDITAQPNNNMNVNNLIINGVGLSNSSNNLAIDNGLFVNNISAPNLIVKNDLEVTGTSYHSTLNIISGRDSAVYFGNSSINDLSQPRLAFGQNPVGVVIANYSPTHINYFTTSTTAPNMTYDTTTGTLTINGDIWIMDVPNGGGIQLAANTTISQNTNLIATGPLDSTTQSSSPTFCSLLDLTSCGNSNAQNPICPSFTPQR